MKKKLLVLFFIVLIVFSSLGYRLYRIVKKDGEKYKKQVLSQQAYDSKPIPARRGKILDTNGTVLAASEKVYNVILDAVSKRVYRANHPCIVGKIGTERR